MKGTSTGTAGSDGHAVHVHVCQVKKSQFTRCAAELAAIVISSHSTQRPHGSTSITELFHSSPAVVAVRDDERVGGRQ